MPDFIYPLLSLILDFICLLMCIKFIFSKRGGVWIVPSLLSLVFLAASALCLLAQTSTKTDASILIFAKALSNFFLGASIIWLLVIIIFRIALNPDDLQSVKSKRNKAESDFLKAHTTQPKDKEKEKEVPKETPKSKVVKPVVEDPYKEVRTVSPRRYINEN